MRIWLVMAGSALLAGCGAEQRVGNEPAADINAAAEAAQGDIDTYAANSLQSATPVASPPSASPTRKPLLGPVSSPDSLQGTAKRVPRSITVAARTADYRCAGETRISVRFDDEADTATVRRDGRDVAMLDGQRPASGIWYKGGGYELRGKGRDADFTAPDHAPVRCSTD